MKAVKAPDHQQVMAHCAAVSYCDDRLGHYSDHEGNEEGPAYHHWEQGRESFELHCLRAIEDHKQAIAVWRKFARLNRKRTETEEKKR